MLAKHLLDCFRMRESPVFSMFGFAANPSANVKVGVMDERSQVSQMSETILEPSLPSEAEVNLAKDARRVLAARMKQDGSPQLCILNDPFREEALNLPASAVRILERTLEEMARGNAVMLIPVHAELTTHEAANLSRPDRPALRSKVVTKSVTKHCPIMPIYDQILVAFLR